MQETAKTNKHYVYSGSSFIKKKRYKIVSIFIVLILITITIFFISNKEHYCMTPIKSIFYQPLLKDKILWRETLQKLKEARIEKLILQWSKFGVVDFVNSEQWLKEILSEAEKRDIKVVVGLYGDDKYFKTLESRATDIPKYLKHLKNQNILQAKKIYAIAKNSPSFYGYYIYDEIDETNFKEPSRQQQLKEYLSELAYAIKTISPHPLYISSYFSNQMPLEEYSQMLSEVTQQKYHLLLQSGIGANLVDSNSSATYMKTFHTYFKGSFSPIVEGFKFENSQIRATDFSSLQKQITLIQKSSQIESLSLFSLRYFLEESLFREYLQYYCKEK